MNEPKLSNAEGLVRMAVTQLALTLNQTEVVKAAMSGSELCEIMANEMKACGDMLRERGL
jgi:hypothetical protein